MADAIKFRCKGCEKKIAVRAEYAGKRVKCPGCKQPIRVPAPRPKRSSTGVPVAVGASSDAPTANGGSSMTLADLLAMEERAPVKLRELSSKATRQSNAPRIEGGKDCPSCDASVKPDAMLCVHCGHNFESGKRLKTKKSKEKVAAAKGPKTLKQKAIYGLAIAGIVAIAGAAIWGVITAMTG